MKRAHNVDKYYALLAVCNHMFFVGFYILYVYVLFCIFILCA